MNAKIGTSASACASADGVAGGRKTHPTVAETIGGKDAFVLATVGRDDAVVFSDEVESVPALDTESDEEEESEEEEEEESEEEYDEEDAELDEGLAERLRILADAKALKTLAVAFLRPEEPVAVTDATVFGRNYFARPSAPQPLEDEDADEEAEILADALKLKAAARAYLHPEDPVEVDGAAFGRNYFGRPSAPETEDAEAALERARILAEARVLKHAAADWMHPEAGVTATYGAAFGRNYFERASAPEQEEDEFADERAEALADAAALKKLAADYLHPEVGVTAVDGAAFGRNYFNRYSAPDIEDLEDEARSVGTACPRNEYAQERARVLAEAASLKKLAADYLHPEVGVTAADPALFGRNYFNRASAPETEEDEFADERAEALADAAALKKLAADYLHPEVGVTATDATVFGRNYFDRPSAPETEDEDAGERARVLADALALKQSAADYLHPEVGVTTSDPAAFGRNYFNRYSAPETEEDEFAAERALVLAEAAALKKSAVDYMHPEVGVTATDGAAFGRNYFNRPSAPETEDEEEADERALVLAEAAALKKQAVDYLHPEVGVTATDPTAFGRNYFTRYSAPAVEAPTQAKTEGPAESQDVAAVQNLAAAVKGANLPSTKTAKLSSADGDFSAAKKSASQVNLFGLTEQVM